MTNSFTFTKRLGLGITGAIAGALLLSGAAAGILPAQQAFAETSDEDVYLLSDSAYANSEYLVTYNRQVPDGDKVQLNGTDMFENRAGAWVALVTADEAAALTNESFSVVEADGSESDSALLGDVNANGAVNIVDVQIIYDLARGAYATTDLFTDEQLLLADVNADRILDASDALATQHHMFSGVWDDVTPFVPGTDSGEEEADTLTTALAKVDKALASADATDTTTSVTDLGNNVYLVSFGTAPSAKVSGDTYSISKKNKVTITAGGIYYFTNKSTSAVTGRVEVAVADATASTTLVMGGLNLTSDDADGVFTITKDNTASTELVLRDGTTSTLADTAAVTTETDGTLSAPDGALVIKKGNDLTISGTGTLSVSSTNGTGVKCISVLDETTNYVSGGHLTIQDATVKVTSAGNNGISAKAGLILNNCTVEAVDVNGDGIKTTTPDDETDTTLGNLVATNAKITVDCYEDGIQVYRNGTFINCTVSIKTTNDSAHATTVEGETKDSWKGVKTDGSLTIMGGTWDINAADKALKSGTDSDDTTTTTSSALTTLATSTEASSALTIDGGTFTLVSTDDAVHSNGDVVIGATTADLTMALSAGDDAIHADYTLTVNGGTITATKCYEGLEGADIVVNGGTIRVVSSDDGFNAAGGSDTQSTGGGDSFRPGPGSRSGQSGSGSGSTTTSDNYTLTINGGTITVIPGGDGLDSNGDLYINGGTIYVSGPSTGGNGCLDYGDSNATFKITGGTLVAVGTSDMAVYPTTSGQAYVAYTSSSSYAAGSTVEVKATQSATADALVSYTTECSSKYVMASSADLTSGTKYYIYVNGNYVGSTTAATTGSSGGDRR